MRVLYVALTRSKEKLIIIGTQKKAEEELNTKQELLDSTSKGKEKINLGLVKKYKTYLDWIELMYLWTDKPNLIDTKIHYKSEFIQDALEEKKETTEILQQIIEEKMKNTQMKADIDILNWKYPNIKATIIPSKSTVTEVKNIAKEEQMENTPNILEELKIEKKVELKMPQFLTEEAKLSGAQKGTTIHLVLQKLDFNKNYNKKDIEELIQQLKAKNLITEQEIENIDIQKLINFTNSELYKEISTAKEVYKEAPFYIGIPAKEIYGGEIEEEILVQGIIDLYYKDKEGRWVLVDYKTDYVLNNNENVLIQKYKKQLEIYKKAIEEGRNEEVHKMYIYSTHLSKAIEII